MVATLPNTLSAIRLLLSPVFFVLLISDIPLYRHLSLAVFFLAALSDWYDGEIARARGTVTNLGKFLDPLADKFLTSAAFVGFAALDVVAWWMVAVIIVRDVLITLLRSVAELRGLHVVTSKSAQTKTFIQMAVLYYLLLLVVGRDVGWAQSWLAPLLPTLLHPTLVTVLMSAVTFITLVTGAQYLYDNRGLLRASLVPTRRPAS